MNRNIITTVVLAAAFSISSCTDPKGDGPMNGDKTFPTAEEAVAKAKSDLLQALETTKDLNVGIDPARLREAQQGRLVRYVHVDFERMLAMDSVMSLADVVADEKSMIAPFVLGNEVVGIVEVARVPEGWKVAGLAHKGITDDLNEAGATQLGDAAVTLYEVPNLQLMVYGVQTATGEQYHLTFERFTMREPVPVAAFYPLMRDRAREFNARFGEQAKKGELVK